VAEVQRWIDNGEYQNILDGRYPRRSQDSETNIGREAGRATESYRDDWNRTKDPLVNVVRDVAGGAAGAGGRIFGAVAGRWSGGWIPPPPRPRPTRPYRHPRAPPPRPAHPLCSVRGPDAVIVSSAAAPSPLPATRRSPARRTSPTNRSASTQVAVPGDDVLGG